MPHAIARGAAGFLNRRIPHINLKPPASRVLAGEILHPLFTDIEEAGSDGAEVSCGSFGTS